MNGDARSLSYSTARKVDRICDQFEAMLLKDGQPKIEEFLSQAAGAVERDSLLRGLLSIEIELLARRESVPEMDAYRRRFPEDGSAVVEVYREALKRAGSSAAERALAESNPSPPPGNPETVSLREPTGDTSCDSSQAAEDAAPELGREFGRFRILKVLGTGGFGFVYHAYDPQLDREVALKVPRAEAAASTDK